MTEHTPGPWTVTPRKHDPRFAHVVDVNGYTVAANVNAANARLIAAAPDLLAAPPSDDAISDAVARVTSAYRMHFTSAAVCDEVHAAVVREILTLMLPTRAAIQKATEGA